MGRDVSKQATVAQETAPAFWRRPVAWVLTWLVYSMSMLGYLAYESAQRGVFCLSAGA